MSTNNHHGQGEPSHPVLAPLIAMINLLPPAAVAEVGRALHAKLNAPPTAAERRGADLGFLARLLDEKPQHPDQLPYIPRMMYDARRARNQSAGPPSARLQEKFGSWARACHAAWGLLPDGRSWGRGEPWPRPPRHPKNYEREEAVASVRRCRKALGHIPSASEYHAWIQNRRARARITGTTVRPFAPYSTLMRLLAPDRANGNGMRLVVERVFTAEVATPSRDDEGLPAAYSEDQR